MSNVEYVNQQKELLLQQIKNDPVWKDKIVQSIGIGKNNNQYCIIMSVDSTKDLPTSINSVAILYQELTEIKAL